MGQYINQAILFFQDEEGASAIEYALLVALIVLAIVAVLGVINRLFF